MRPSRPVGLWWGTVIQQWREVCYTAMEGGRWTMHVFVAKQYLCVSSVPSAGNSVFVTVTISLQLVCNLVLSWRNGLHLFTKWALSVYLLQQGTATVSSPTTLVQLPEMLPQTVFGYKYTHCPSSTATALPANPSLVLSKKNTINEQQLSRMQ